MIITRQTLSPLIQGVGIEIGAYHNPWPVGSNVKVTYVDKWPHDKLIQMRDNDPNLGPGKPISRVDLIDDGQTLSKIHDGSQDFVLSSHQLEHCVSPITAVENHVRVLKKGGRVFYVVPDKRFTFDKDRELTKFDDLQMIHFISAIDYEFPETLKKVTLDLFKDYYRVVDKIESATKLHQMAEHAYANNIDVHFHCWDAISLVDMLSRIAGKIGFDIEIFGRAGHENFVVLRKQ